MADNSKGLPCRSFVRVRPFTEEEQQICPPGSIIPREAITWDHKNTITLLDPQDNFQPRRGGTFNPVDVLWSFKDDDGRYNRALASQKDVYDKVVLPCMNSIVEGYNASFCVAGAASSGRCYTMYGDGVDGQNRGLLPRFAEDIFDAFDRQREENSRLYAEVEAVDVAGESYVDLLATRRTRAGTNGQAEEVLKVQQGPEGARLSGVTTMELKGTADLKTILKQLHRNVLKRTSTHTVSLRFTETFEFDDPEQLGQSISKSRRVQVLFVMLRNTPSAFQRVVDVAAEHDSGENPMAKVPVRETAFTKLYPELFQCGFHLHLVSCVSPYYEHVRENANTMQFSMKARKLRGKPKVNQDESLVEMRRLADEVKDLKVAVRKQSEAMNFVQKELNAREVELMKREAEHNRVSAEIVSIHQVLNEKNSVRQAELAKNKKVQKQLDAELEAQRARMRATQEEKTSKQEAVNMVTRAADDATVRVQAVEAKIAKQKENTGVYQRRLLEYEEEERVVQEIETFNLDDPDEQQRKIILQSDLHKEAEAELQKVQREEVGMRAADDTSTRISAMQADYDKVIKMEAPCKEKEELLSEIAKLEKEIASIEAETRRLQAEIDQKKSECACCTM